MDIEKYICGFGPMGAKIVIVSECPTEDDVRNHKAYTGSAGRELDKVLKEAGIDSFSCWKTFACKYYVPPNIGDAKIPFKVRAEQEGINLQTEYNDLQVEIAGIQPNVIICLGSTALYAITGKSPLTDYRGSILTGYGKKVVATYHPKDFIFAKGGESTAYWQRQIMLVDLKRAKEESLTSQLILPSRMLRVARSSADVYEFFRKYKDHKNPAVDIEALECIPSCIGFAFTPYEGMTIPLWNVKGLSTIPDSDMAMMWIYVAEALVKYDIIGQNFKYDQDKINRLGFIIKHLFSDTMLKAFAINPELPKSLAFNTSIYTREPFYKNEGMYEGSVEDLFLGCARDSCVTKEVDLAMDSDLDELGMRPYYENFILKLHWSYLKTENIGFRIDAKAREVLIEKYVKWQEANAYELWQLCGTQINSNSPKQIASLLFDNFKLPRRAGTGEEELTSLLAQHGKNKLHKRVMELILEDRRVKKTINTYLLAMPDFDGRMKSTFFLCLDTGRTSTGQQDPPIRPSIEVKNLSNKKIDKVLGTAFQTMTKHGDIGEDLRSMYVADPGEVFINIDSSQAEARVVFLLADDEQALIDIDKHDYHALTASWFFGGTEDDYSKKILGYESPIRFCGKTLRHAGHLGASKKRAALSVNTDARKYKINISIDEKFAETALRIFHARQPSIQQVFHKGIQDCLANDGRRLRAPVPYGVDAEFGPIRQFFERWGDELFRKGYSYIPQRTVTDNTKAAKLRIENELQGIKCILESHDALLFSIRINEVGSVVPVLKREMERPICFKNCSMPRRDLIIPSDVEIGENYKNLVKYR